MRLLTCAPAVLLLGLAGCVVTPEPGAPTAGSAAVERRLADLERGGDPQAVLEYVTSVSRSMPRSRRSRLDLARARALTELGRPRSALSAYQAAANGLTRADPLTATVLEEWADAEVQADRPAAALKHYEEALAAGAPPEHVLASMSAVALSLGREQDATEFRRRIGRDAPRLVAAATVRLGLLQKGNVSDRVPATRETASYGGIPLDPRSILSDIHPRSAWGAQPIGPNHEPMTTVRSITVHHSAMDAPGNGTTSAQLRRIQDDHRSARGWADIGYHFLVDPSGEVWEGRALVIQGAHAGGTANVGNIGVCVLGNFDQQWVPGSQLMGLERLLDRLRQRFGVSATAVRTHSEWKATACPGRHLQAAVESYRSRPYTLARQ